MSEKQIIKMLKDIVQEIDYDIYKCYFEYDRDDEEAIDPQALIDIVKKYVK